jgi:hypothetical protein
MRRLRLTTIGQLSALTLVLALGFFGVRAGTTLAGNQASSPRSAPTTSSALPCQFGGPNCIDIGFTKASFGGNTVDFGYSHDVFCTKHPDSGAKSGCEAGAPAKGAPPSGPVVSNLYAIIPMGFTPPKSTLQCPKPGHCIDWPNTIDLSRIGGMSNATFPAHSQIIEDDESFQSTWWPLVIVGVKSMSAWNTLVSDKSADAMDACEAAHHCTNEMPTNAFVFFQVLGPGMSPTGPA